jgi:hypothetical protein
MTCIVNNKAQPQPTGKRVQMYLEDFIKFYNLKGGGDDVKGIMRLVDKVVSAVDDLCEDRRPGAKVKILFNWTEHSELWDQDEHLDYPVQRNSGQETILEDLSIFFTINPDGHDLVVRYACTNVSYFF